MNRTRTTGYEILIGILLVGLCFAVYGVVLAGFFSGTDTFSLIETGRVEDLQDLARILVRPLMAGTGFTSIALYYRPVSSLSFGVDYFLWGLRPSGYFLTNLVLHAANSVMVFYLLRTQGRMMLLSACLGALLFLLQPIMVEAVPVISRRQDMLALFFGLLALLTYRHRTKPDRRRGLLRIASLAFFALGLLAKEIAAVFTVLIPADRVLVGRSEGNPSSADLRQGVKDSLPYVGVLALYLLIRLGVLGGMGGELYHGGIAESGGLRRSAAILVDFVREIADPSNDLASSESTAWVVALLGSALLFGAAAGAASWRADAGSDRTDSTGILGQHGTVRTLTIAVLLTAGCLLTGFSLASARLSQGAAVASEIWMWALAIGAGVAVILISLLAGARRWDSVDVGLGSRLRLLAYYSLWILLPLSIYMATGTFAARGIYVPSVGVAAVLAGGIDAIPEALAPRRSLRENRIGRAGFLGAAALLLFLGASMLLSSPAWKGLGEWPAKSRLAKAFFAEFESEIGVRGPCGQIVITGLPDRGAIGLEEYSVQSWLNMRYADWNAKVHLEDRPTLTTIPADLVVHPGECIDGQLRAWIELP